MHHNEIPIHNNTPDYNRQVGKSHSAKRYIERAHETLTTRVFKLICATFIGLLIIVGIITFILWLSLRPHRPKFNLQDFSISGFDQVEVFEGAQVIFDVTARNPNQNMGYSYDAIQVVLSYQDQDIGSTTVLSPFFQEKKNITLLHGVLSGKNLTINNQRWMQFQADRAKGVVIFRLDFMSAIRFKLWSWNSRRHKVHANCEIGVGPDGMVLASYKDKKFRVYFT
ncbi:NDR1/HIN1-like protein 26 [Impatiens glandulifera]|uniref:NDR1/HIN1-like protein 26 n=1 Tax=Impatiens glandulifera TaxID=253017 RepID=UPI001FB18805|nr:NDR1/HIN1-like protein 26 [Impatiens glandulifera]